MKPMPERMSGMPMCQFLSLNFLLLQAMYVLQRRCASDMPPSSQRIRRTFINARKGGLRTLASDMRTGSCKVRQ